MRHVSSMIHRAAASDASILIAGGSGTVKDVVARAIHERSGLAKTSTSDQCGGPSPGCRAARRACWLAELHNAAAELAVAPDYASELLSLRDVSGAT